MDGNKLRLDGSFTAVEQDGVVFASISEFNKNPEGFFDKSLFTLFTDRISKLPVGEKIIKTIDDLNIPELKNYSDAQKVAMVLIDPKIARCLYGSNKKTTKLLYDTLLNEVKKAKSIKERRLFFRKASQLKNNIFETVFNQMRETYRASASWEILESLAKIVGHKSIYYAYLTRDLTSVGAKIASTTIDLNRFIKGGLQEDIDYSDPDNYDSYFLDLLNELPYETFLEKLNAFLLRQYNLVYYPQGRTFLEPVDVMEYFDAVEVVSGSFFPYKVSEVVREDKLEEFKALFGEEFLDFTVIPQLSMDVKAKVDLSNKKIYLLRGHEIEFFHEAVHVSLAYNKLPVGAASEAVVITALANLYGNKYNDFASAEKELRPFFIAAAGQEYYEKTLLPKLKNSKWPLSELYLTAYEYLYFYDLGELTARGINPDGLESSQGILSKDFFIYDPQKGVIQGYGRFKDFKFEHEVLKTVAKNYKSDKVLKLTEELYDLGIAESTFEQPTSNIATIFSFNNIDLTNVDKIVNKKGETVLEGEKLEKLKTAMGINIEPKKPIEKPVEKPVKKASETKKVKQEKPVVKEKNYKDELTLTKKNKYHNDIITAIKKDFGDSPITKSALIEKYGEPIVYLLNETIFKKQNITHSHLAVLLSNYFEDLTDKGFALITSVRYPEIYNFGINTKEKYNEFKNHILPRLSALYTGQLEAEFSAGKFGKDTKKYSLLEKLKIFMPTFSETDIGSFDALKKRVDEIFEDI